MKVLLLHEYSGVHTELQKGLRAHGVTAVTANTGDSYRGFCSDLYMGGNQRTLRAAFSRIFAPGLLIGRMRTFDVVQSLVASPFRAPIRKLMERTVLLNDGVSYVYLAAGSDAIYRKHVRSLEYWPPHDWYENDRRYRSERSTISLAKQIVAGGWDYYHTLRMDGFNPSLIPFPVMTSDYEFREIATRKKIRVFHPMNRTSGPDFKGTGLILAAFDRLRRRFGDDVEFVAAGKMPFHEYMKFVRDVDVIVDQVYSYGYGMSAVFGMAQGKVVLSGLEMPVALEPVYAGAPITNLRPDVGQIEAAVEGILQSRQRLGELGFKSRRFVEKTHDAVFVAEKYINMYNESFV